jgi:O-antigen/teichoic acid export membrane protein
MNEADKLIVAQNFDLASVGLYAAACAIGGFMITFNTSLLNATIPKLYAELSSHTQPVITVIKKFLFEFFSVSIIFAGVFAFFYSLLAEAILPEKYFEAREIVYWVIIFALARSVYSVLGSAIEFLGMTRQKLKGITLGATAALISIYAGVFQFGLVGVAVGVGLGYSTLGIFVWLSLVKRSRLGDYQ